MPTSPDTRDSR